jgi:hypothetical protein
MGVAEVHPPCCSDRVLQVKDRAGQGRDPILAGNLHTPAPPPARHKLTVGSPIAQCFALRGENYAGGDVSDSSPSHLIFRQAH